jgi:glutamyl/glutaminyl-tRNA synthetase
MWRGGVRIFFHFLLSLTCLSLTSPMLRHTLSRVSFPPLKKSLLPSFSSSLSKKKLHYLLSQSAHPDPATMNVRVRFAPSPTGSLHIGGARTALFNYLFAKKYNGQFILRVEDTDEERSSRQSEESILNDLRWLGLQWDEGPDVGGPCGPYRQSDRKDIYLKCAEKLIQQGDAYRCFCTDEELQAMKGPSPAPSSTASVSTPASVPGSSSGSSAPSSLSSSPHFQSPWRDAPTSEVNAMLASGAPYTIRFRTPNQRLYIDDMVRGHVSWDAQANIGDFILIRSNRLPVYNFCVAVDDVLMNITHVIRAEEHLSNTLRQLLVIQSLNSTPPIYAHCSLILGSDRSKLSKRHGATSLTEFKQQGYLPQSLINYLSTLGWNDGTSQEIYRLTELINQFTLHRLVKASAMFNPQKLEWINKQHLRQVVPRKWLKEEIHRILTQETQLFPSTTETMMTSEHLKTLLMSLFLDSSQVLLVNQSLVEEVTTLSLYPLLETIQTDPKAVKLVTGGASSPFALIANRLIDDFNAGTFPSLFSEVNYHPMESPLSPTPTSSLSCPVAGSVNTTPPAPAVSSHGELFNANWEQYVISLAGHLSLPLKQVFHPLRLAVTGRMKGVDVGGQLEILQLIEPLLAHSTAEDTLQLVNLSQRMKILEQYLLSTQQRNSLSGGGESSGL